MTLRLILIRHAKSAWDDPFADDHARVLNARGRESATAVGAWLTERGYRPEQILSSDSARTTETVKRITSGWDPAPEITYLPALYHAAPMQLLETLRAATARVVALVAHNPGIGSFAGSMVTTPPEHPRFFDYPTCATTVMDFDIEKWNDAAPGKGRVVDFIVPRDLIG